jgi:hypothetical protein
MITESELRKLINFVINSELSLGEINNTSLMKCLNR